jgi:hypothetical protein
MNQNKENIMDVDRWQDATYFSAEKIGELLTDKSCKELDVPDEKLLNIVAAGIADDQRKLKVEN